MAELQELLNQAEDIVILEKNPAENRYRFAFPFSGDFARQCYQASSKLNTELPEFDACWKFNGQINGSNPFLLTRAQRVLRPIGLELPDTLDLLKLDKQGKLKNGFYRDCGIYVHSDSQPNQETAKALIEKGKQEGCKLPLVWGFGDLDYKVVNGHAQIISVAQPKRIISGKRAKAILEKFYRAGDSGAQRVSRDGSGDWDVGWNGFAFSGSDDLVDWLVAEGDRENLRQGYNNLFLRKYQAQKEKLRKEIAQLDEQRKAEETTVLESLKA